MPRSTLVFLVGAAAYALLIWALDVTFNATPLLIGIVVLAAAWGAGARSLLPAGLVLVAWGMSVLLVREGPLPPEREPAVYMVAVAIGLLAAVALAGKGGAGLAWLASGILAALAAGMAYYFSYDADWLNRWPFWSGVLVVWGLWQAVRDRT